MAIQAQRVDQDGIYVKVSSGLEVTITPTVIKDKYDNETGSDEQRRIKTRIYIKSLIEGALGSYQLPTAKMDLDFDPETGIPVNFEVIS